jgi:hypothetical protein
MRNATSKTAYPGGPGDKPYQRRVDAILFRKYGERHNVKVKTVKPKAAKKPTDGRPQGTANGAAPGTGPPKSTRSG